MRISDADPATIRAELAAVAAHAEVRATLVLIGGCNLAVRGVKSSTKDVDLVLRDCPRPPAVLEAFDAAGFKVADGYYLPGAPLDPHTMLQNKRGTWVDLFLPDRLFGDLSYSEAMASREEAWFQQGQVSCRLADPAAVFLLKAVTGRWRTDPDRDISDLADLVDRGIVDWRFVEAEWARQLSRHEDADALRKVAREATARLAGMGYRRLPWRP